MTKIIENQFQKVEFLEEGGQAKIFLVKNIVNNKNYALKIIKSSKKDEIQRFKNEITFLKKIDSPYVIKIVSTNLFTKKKGKLYYIMDFAKYGTLKNNDYYIKDINSCLLLFEKICMGVKVIHDNNIIHRDIRPSNILLVNNLEDVRISDFGLACDLEKLNKNNIEIRKKIGAPYFSAPEEKQQPAKPVKQSDFFSLGKVLYYMINGKQLKKKIEKNNFIFRKKSKKIENFIKLMCNQDFKKRPKNIEDVIKIVTSFK